MKQKQKYFIFIVVFTLLSSTAAYFLVEPVTGYSHLQQPLALLCVLLGVISLLNGMVLFKYVEKRPQVFIRAFMASFTLKFFINLVVLASYLYLFKIGRIPIVICFFFLFVLYTVVEKTSLFKAFNVVKTD